MVKQNRPCNHPPVPYNPYRPLPSPPIASTTKSANVARTCRMRVFARVGFTRFVSRIMKTSRSGSIQIDVPVNPVCPNERRDNLLPALE